MARHRTTITFLLYFLVYASVAVRGVSSVYEQDEGILWEVIVLLVAYGVLLASEGWISRRIVVYTHVYLALQSIIILILLIITPQLDYFVLLFIPLSVQAMLAFPLRTGYGWIGIFALATAIGLIASYGVGDALPFILIYAAVYLFVASYATVTKQAELAQAESEALLDQLQQAHQQLQDYAAQVEHLAVVEERNRLARDLHDSVTQALYSLTLYAEAASRQLTKGAYTIVADHLVDLRQTAQQALQEMRLLIFELRPPLLEEEGLTAALRARIDSVESRSGLSVMFKAHGVERLQPDLEIGLYRIAQEALNNVLKHAEATEVLVNLEASDRAVILEVVDNGKGFDIDRARHGGGLGLQSIQERAQQLGGTALMQSEPTKGTTLKVEVAL